MEGWEQAVLVSWLYNTNADNLLCVWSCYQIALSFTIVSHRPQSSIELVYDNYYIMKTSKRNYALIASKGANFC